MEIKLSGLYGWLVIGLCAVALIVGLLAVIEWLYLHIGKLIHRRRILLGGDQLTPDADGKLIFLLEELLPLDDAAELAEAIADPNVTYDHMELIYNNIKNKTNEHPDERPTDSPA